MSKDILIRVLCTVNYFNYEFTILRKACVGILRQILRAKRAGHIERNFV